MPALDLHPTYDGETFTLRGIFRDEVEAWRKSERLRQEGQIVYAYAEEVPTGRELFYVAARHDLDPAPRARIPHESTTEWDAVRIAIEVFRRIARAAERKGYEFQWNKPLEEERLKDCIASWHWGGTVLEVAGDILTKTLQAHPFPNANHRTSTALARLYLDAIGVPWPHYSLRGKGINRFHRDTRDFVRKSKYLLHMMRHQAIIRIAYEEGFDEVELKDGATVEVQERDVEASRSQLRDKHQAEAERMISDLASNEAAEDLGEPNPIGLSDWVAHGQS